MTIKVDFNKYKAILEAETVTIHHLVQHYKKSDLDFDSNGNIFIGFNDKTKGLPILVAHLDNVLDGKREPMFDLNQRYLQGRNTGIGFDDKAGIIAITELWHTYKKKQMFRIIFTADEEIGGVGAEAMDDKIYADAPWILELDRKGSKDFIQVSGTTRLCSDQFADAFLKMGFEIATGTFTDVNQFKKNHPEINMANISIGYYNAHTNSEYLDTIAFEKIVNKVKDFIDSKQTFDADKEDDLPQTRDGWDWSYFNNNTCSHCGKKINGKAVYDRFGYKYCSHQCKEDAQKDDYNVYEY